MKRRLFIKILRKLDKRNYLFPNGSPKTLKIGDFQLLINELDSGGTAYASQSSHKEIANKLYDLINKEYMPKTLLDIGANYGFSSIMASSKNPTAKVIAVEPSKALIPYIKASFKLNKVKDFEIINAICGEFSNEAHEFSINPNTSQDNRVIGENRKWKKQSVPVVNITSLLEKHETTEAVFIKIDTQGYEEKVFMGGEQFLVNHNNWIIKAEFAPYWLKSQGTDPVEFLRYLVKKYKVIELPEIIPYFHGSIADMFKNNIQEEYIKAFVEYVENLNKNQTGWIDILVKPNKNGS